MNTTDIRELGIALRVIELTMELVVELEPEFVEFTDSVLEQVGKVRELVGKVEVEYG